MKTMGSIILLLFAASSFAQQKETFDLATYTAPTSWKKVSSGSDVTGYATTNNLKGTYCQLAIYKSMNSMGNAQLDFETEWQDLVAKSYNVTAKPEAGPSVNKNQNGGLAQGWEAKSGVAPFEFSGGQSIAMLVTMSGYGKRMSIVVLTNTQDFQLEIENFLESVDLKKLETLPVVAPLAQTTVANDSNFILGIWKANASDQSSWRVNNGVMSTISRQYTFDANGTYTFITKTFDPLMDKLLLGKENGTYQINGNTIAVNPNKSVLEAWSKKDGTDNWGNLLTTQNITPEQTTYRFTKHYFEGIQSWSLVLQADNATKRDGSFNGNTTFTNAWYYGTISPTNDIIELPGSEQIVKEEIKSVSLQPAVVNGFTFTTTNFDDGWISTEQEDWVQVIKGSTRVLIHYPNKVADEYNSVLLDGLKTAWNVLVAPRYSSASNFEFKPISSWQSIGFAEEDMVEKTSGKSVHVVLFIMHYSNGSGKYMEFITANKSSFEQQFGAYHQSTSGWEKMEQMANYNKFAVAASDLKGKWTNNFTGMTQYVNVYTGASAGADTHASKEIFEFGAGNNYKWELNVASGMVGNIKFQNVKSTGNLTIPNNWQIKFSDLDGKPKTYNAYFSCIKNARMLWLEDSAYTSGYTGYGKME